MGFNAPRIIGGGQIQQPRQVNAMDQIADATWKAAEMKQKEDKYDRDFYQDSINQNMKEKWLKQNFRAQAFEEYKLAPEYHIVNGKQEKVPFHIFFNKKYPDFDTMYGTDNFTSQYDEYLRDVNNPNYLGKKNPVDNKWYFGKGFMDWMNSWKAKTDARKAKRAAKKKGSDSAEDLQNTLDQTQAY